MGADHCLVEGTGERSVMKGLLGRSALESQRAVPENRRASWKEHQLVCEEKAIGRQELGWRGSELGF